MTGVEILASNEVLVKSLFNWKLCWIIGGSLFGLCAITGVIISVTNSDWDLMPIFLFMGLMCGAFCGSIIGAAYDIPVEYETQHKATISDEVLMNDFLEKYEIINQDGKIYTVREINKSTI